MLSNKTTVEITVEPVVGLHSHKDHHTVEPSRLNTPLTDFRLRKPQSLDSLVVPTKPILSPIKTTNLIDNTDIPVDSDSDGDLDDLKLMKRKDVDTNALADFFKNTGPEMFGPVPSSKDLPLSPPERSLKGLLTFFNRKKVADDSSFSKPETAPSAQSKDPSSKVLQKSPTTQSLRLRRKKTSGGSLDKSIIVDQQNNSISQAPLSHSEQRFRGFQESYNDVKVDNNGVSVYKRKIKVSYNPMDILIDDNCASIVSKASLEEELEDYAYKNMVVSVKAVNSSKTEDKASFDMREISASSDGTVSSEPSSPVETKLEYFPVAELSGNKLNNNGEKKEHDLYGEMAHRNKSFENVLLIEQHEDGSPRMLLNCLVEPKTENLSLSLEEQVKLLNQELFQERRRRFRAEESNRQTKLKCDQVSAQACKALKLLMNEKYRLEAEVKRLQGVVQAHQLLSQPGLV